MKTDTGKDISRWWLLGAVLFSAVVFFVNLGSEGIYAAQEGRSAIIARNMLRTGDWASMEFSGAIPYEKPILHSWIVAASGWFFDLGDAPEQVLTEWAVRLPSAVGALLTVIAAGLLAGRIYGRRTACLAMVMLASMATFTNLGRLAHIDMLLTCSYAWAMYFLFIGYFEKMRANGFLYLFYLMLGLGMLLKGPGTTILAGLTVLGMMICRRDALMPFRLRPLPGAVIFLAVGLSWYVFEYIRTDGAFFEEFFLKQNIQRFTSVGSTYRGGEIMPMWYYLPKFFAGTLPWSVFAIPAFWIYRRNLVNFRFRPLRREAAYLIVGALLFAAAVVLQAVGWLGALPATVILWLLLGLLIAWGFARGLFRLAFRPETVYLLMWVLTGVLFFSLAALKRGDYILPVYPAAAVLTARAVDLCLDRCPALSRKWLWGFAVVAVLLAAVMALNASGAIAWFAEKVVSREIKWISRTDGRNTLMISESIAALGVWGWAALAAALAYLFALGKLLEKRRIAAAFLLLLAALLGGYIGYFAGLQTRADKLKSVKSFAFDIRRAFPEETEFGIYYDFNTELLYFLDRPYRKIASGEGMPDDIDYLITNDKGERALQAEHPELKYAVLERTVDGHHYEQALLRIER